jgi:hypothetical protein
MVGTGARTPNGVTHQSIAWLGVLTILAGVGVVVVSATGIEASIDRPKLRVTKRPTRIAPTIRK